jgi:Tfp pilus assembly protein PilF
LTSPGAAGTSIDDLRRAIEVSPADGSMWGNLGFLLYERGDLPGAASAFARATALTPLRALNWLGSALVKLRQRDFDGADADATRAFELDPALGLARAIRGECLLKRGRPCEALAAVDGVRIDDPAQQVSLDQLRAAAAAACPDRP